MLSSCTYLLLFRSMQFNCTMQYFLLEFDIGFANFVYKSVRGKMRKQFHFNNDQMRHVNT